MKQVNKVKYIKVSTQIIADILKRAIENKVPEDTEVIRVNYNALTNNWELVLHSKEFSPVSEGGEIPQLQKDPVVSDDVLK